MTDSNCTGSMLIGVDSNLNPMLKVLIKAVHLHWLSVVTVSDNLVLETKAKPGSLIPICETHICLDIQSHFCPTLPVSLYAFGPDLSH